MSELSTDYAKSIGQLIMGGIIASAVLLFVHWVNSPTMDEIRQMVDKDSPWTKERLLFVNRLESLERADASLSARIESILSKLETMQGVTASELRSINNSLYRLMARLELMDEAKKEDEHQ